jgi:hypothetical protein
MAVAGVPARRERVVSAGDVTARGGVGVELARTKLPSAASNSQRFSTLYGRLRRLAPRGDPDRRHEVGAASRTRSRSVWNEDQ